MKRSSEDLRLAEKRRLSALRSLGILDGRPTDELRRLTELASIVTETDFAAITLLDETRQVFFSSVGADGLREAPREGAFCNETIMQDGILQHEDLTADAGTSSHPMVAGAPNMRSYAGMPLRTTGGEAIGTLCVLGKTPKSLSADQKRCLALITELVVAEIERRDWVGEGGRLAFERMPLATAGAQRRRRGLWIGPEGPAADRLNRELPDFEIDAEKSPFRGCALFERALRMDERPYSLVVVDKAVEGLSWRTVLERIRGIDDRIAAAVMTGPGPGATVDAPYLGLSLDEPETEWLRKVRTVLGR